MFASFPFLHLTQRADITPRSSVSVSPHRWPGVVAHGQALFKIQFPDLEVLFEANPPSWGERRMTAGHLGQCARWEALGQWMLQASLARYFVLLDPRERALQGEASIKPVEFKALMSLASLACWWRTGLTIDLRAAAESVL